MSKTVIIITGYDNNPLSYPSIDVFSEGHFTGTSVTFTGTGYAQPKEYYRSYEYVLQRAHEMEKEYSDSVILDKWNEVIKFPALLKELKALSPMRVMFECYK